MPARRRSSCKAAACETGVTSGSVARMIRVYASSCSLIDGVTMSPPFASNSLAIRR